jgi:hypothetical protein
MSNIILTTPEELKAIVQDAVSGLLSKSPVKEESLPDTITLATALDLLVEHGYPTSRAKVYKLTSAGAMPHRKYGNKLVFSRKELLQWAQGNTRQVGDLGSVASAIAASANRKNRSYGK